MSYKVIFIEANGSECGNGLRFPDQPTAVAYYLELSLRWTGCPADFRVAPSTDPVSEKYAVLPAAERAALKEAGYECDENGDEINDI